MPVRAHLELFSESGLNVTLGVPLRGLKVTQKVVFGLLGDAVCQFVSVLL